MLQLIFFSSGSQFHTPGFHGFLDIVYDSSDILYISSQFIVQVCWTISYAFSSEARIVRLLLLSYIMCLSMGSNSDVTQNPLRNTFLLIRE